MLISGFTLIIITISFPSYNALVLNVTQHGNNNEQCLQGHSNCSTIGYALGGIPSDTLEASTTINVYYSHNFSISSNVWHVGVGSVNIRGIPSIVITCSELGIGIGFNVSTNINITGIHWKDCSILHPTSAFLWHYHDTPTAFHPAYSALFFYNCTDVRISYCQFSSTRGAGVSMYDVRGSVTVEYTNFMYNSISSVLQCPNTTNESSYGTVCSPMAIGLYIELMYSGEFGVCPSNNTIKATQYSISHCQFVGNKNQGAYGSHPSAKYTLEDALIFWPFGLGGGMAVHLRAHEITGVIVHIVSCNFTDNVGLWGGGLFMKLLSPNLQNNTITIDNCSFNDNNAVYSGGGARLGLIYIAVNSTNGTSNTILLNDVNFSNNSAYWGGGLSVYNNPADASHFTLKMKQSKWFNNSAIDSAAALGLTVWNNVGPVIRGWTVKPSLYSCTFTHNLVVIPTEGHNKQVGYGIVYTEGIPLVITGNTTFYHNYASALYISSTLVYLADQIHFLENVGLLGGGIYLTGTAQITLLNGVNIIFESNNVFQYGGGIYYTFPPSLSLSDSKGCFLRYYNPESQTSEVPLDQWNVSVVFKGNNALLAGDAVYIGNPRECIWGDNDSPFDINRGKQFIYNQSRINRTVVATPAEKMYFITSKLDANGTYPVMPGEAFDLQVSTRDYYNQPSDTTVFSIRCHTENQFKHYDFQGDLCDNSIYRLHGSRVFASGTKLNNLHLSGPEVTNKQSNGSAIVLAMKSNDPWPVIGVLKVQFLPCRLGMVYNADTHSCICVGDTSSYITCKTSLNGTVTPCIQSEYWYGRIEVTDKAVYGVMLCFFLHCRKCSDYCDEFKTLCKIPPKESDYCNEGFTGPLCRECQEGLSLSYDSQSCGKCSLGQKIGLALLIILYWLLVVFEIVLLVYFKFSVGSAALYGILYYYSVVQYITAWKYPFNLSPVIAFIVSFTQLDPHFLAYTEFCLFESATTIQYDALHFINPIAIGALLYSLFYLDQRFSRHSFLSGSSSIHATCILLLITYSSLAQTCMKLLNPLTYLETHPHTEPTPVVVWLQPYTRYMHPTQHLPYALMAILVECCLVLPFAFLMLLAPFVVRIKYVNLTKIKPLLDEYQGCYHDQYRWFAGVYLLARELIYITSLSAIDLQLSAYLRQLLCILLLALHTTVQPYKKKWLNILDTLLLLDITLLSFQVGSTAQNGFVGYIGVLNLITAFLVLLPCLYPLTAAVIRILRKVGIYLKKREQERSLRSPISVETTDGMSEEDLPALRSTSGRWSDTWKTFIAGSTANESAPLLHPTARGGAQPKAKPRTF